MKVFYHNDLDGRCSAAILRRYLRNSGFNEAYYEMDYNKEFPMGEIIENETIYILDFSLQKEGEFEELKKRTSHIVWIDHHKSAVERFEKLNLYGERSIEEAACTLTWKYFFDSKIPLGVWFAGDFDTWKFEGGETTWNFHYGMSCEDTHVENDILWDEILSNNKIIVDSIINNGKLIKISKEISYKEEMTAKAFVSNFEGYKLICCNTGKGSNRFASIDEPYDILSPFSFDGKTWTVSLYSTDPNIDVSEIAKKYSGGGHKGAAGFQCEEIPYKFCGRPKIRE